MDEIVEYITNLKSKKIYVKFSIYYATSLVINDNDVNIIRIYGKYLLSDSYNKKIKLFNEDNLYDYVSTLMINTLC